MKLELKDILIIAGVIGSIVTQVSTCKQKEIELQIMKEKQMVSEGKQRISDKVLDSIVENILEK